MGNGINVLSLFDGISCGMVALERAEIPVNRYVAYEIDKYAIKISEKNYPQIKHCGDVTTADFTQYHGFDLVIAGSPCFPSGTLVLREDGFIPIEDIKVGDMVMTHKGRLRRVLAAGSKLSETIMLKGQGSVGIECTPNHPFYSVSKKYANSKENPSGNTIITKPEWIEAENMQGRFWLNVCNAEIVEVPSFSEANMGHRNGGHIKDFEMTDDFFYFVGRWLGDGWANSHNRKNRIDSKMKRVYVCCSHEESDYLENKLALTGLHFSKNDSGSTIRFTCSSTQLYDWIVGNFGLHADGKNIPYWCLGMRESFRKAMFEGYADADGTMRKNGARSTSINRKLTIGMKLLAGSLHKASSVYLYNNNRDCVIEGRHVNERPIFQQQYNNNSRSAVFLDAGWFGKVRSVEQCRDIAMVYNLEVEEDNSYTVDGIAVHNCQGFSIAGKKLNFNDPRSKLYFEFERALREVEPKYFLLENVKMMKEFSDIITQRLGVQPIEINSNLVSAQNRKRYYWTNIPNVDVPKDKHITLRDIIHENENNCNVDLEQYKIPFDKALRIIDKEVAAGKVRCIDNGNNASRIYSIHGKDVDMSNDRPNTGGYLFGCLTPDREEKRQCGQRFNSGNKFYTLTAQDRHGIFVNGYIRKVTPIECERLQTLYDNYTYSVNDAQRYKCLGNGWTVDVISHILSYLPY